MADTTIFVPAKPAWVRIARAILAGKLARAILGGRRPVLIIPVLVLATVVVAGSTANWIAPHHPTRGDLRDRLLPPFWGNAKITSKAVVGQVEIGLGHRQITLEDARQIDVNAVVGGEVGVLTREGAPSTCWVQTTWAGTS